MCREEEKVKVIVYGLGSFFIGNEERICDEFNVLAYIDKEKKDTSKRIILCRELKDYPFDKVLIMVSNVQECINIASELHAVYGIEANKILLGIDKYKKTGFDSITFTDKGKLRVKVKGYELDVASLDEYNNVCEVLMDGCYEYYMNNGKKDVVIDVGMNIGDTVLYFLNCLNVEKVYAFEPFIKTYLSAAENLNEYLNMDEGAGRLEIFQYGLSDRDEKRYLTYNQNMSCGQSSLVNVGEMVESIYEKWGLVDPLKSEKECIEVKKASKILGEIIGRHPENNIVLKLDCEGEEYGIIDDLQAGGILEKIDFIMMEWHYRGKEKLIDALVRSGFSYWSNNESEGMGMLYAYKCKG